MRSRPVVAQVDGLSGTGKSALAAELARRGHRAVDADAEVAYFGDPVTGEPTTVTIRDHWIWDVPRLRALCAEGASPVLVCGGAINQERCADVFTHRFLLRVDDDTMRQRLLIRTGNDYGKDARELAEQIALNQREREQGGRPGWVTIDATQPLPSVADAVLRGIA